MAATTYAIHSKGSAACGDVVLAQDVKIADIEFATDLPLECFTRNFEAGRLKVAVVDGVHVFKANTEFPFDMGTAVEDDVICDVTLAAGFAAAVAPHLVFLTQFIRAGRGADQSGPVLQSRGGYHVKTYAG